MMHLDSKDHRYVLNVGIRRLAQATTKGTLRHIFRINNAINSPVPSAGKPSPERMCSFAICVELTGSTGPPLDTPRGLAFDA